MRVKKDGLMLCDDCMIVACNGDTSGIDDDARVKEVEEGLDSLGPCLVSDFDIEDGSGIHEFSWSRCDCCGDSRGGSRHEFAILEEEDDGCADSQSSDALIRSV